MSQIIEVFFDGEVFRPERSIALVPRRRYVITVQDLPDEDGTDAWDVLDALAGSIVAPVDWSTEHDHYLYGTPKRESEDQG